MPWPVSDFDGFWISSAQIFKSGQVQASLLPYDGAHLLATGTKRLNMAALPAEVMTALKAEITRLSGKADAPELVQVMAQDPSKPVMVQVLFPRATPAVAPYRIADAFALCGTDAQFAGVFGQVMASIAQLAGCTVSA